jgi:hypothetical protein
MIHVYSVALEMQYDDEEGEYTTPSLKEIERHIGGSLKSLLTALGFTDVSIEAGKGTIADVFGE